VKRRAFLSAVLAKPVALRQVGVFFMYPQAEAAGARRDSLDPERLRYTISTRDV